MEDDAVVEAVAAQLDEVVDGLGRVLVEELELDRALAGVHGGVGHRGRLRDGDEIRPLLQPQARGEGAHVRPSRRARDRAADERAGKGTRLFDADDRRAVNPLAELARVDLDEGGERRAGAEELARERLPGRAGAPDDGGTAAASSVSRRWWTLQRVNASSE